MRRIALAVAVAAVALSATPVHAQFFSGAGPGPILAPIVAPEVNPVRNQAFFALNAFAQVNSFVPAGSRPLLERANRVVFQAFGISRVTRFFGIF